MRKLRILTHSNFHRLKTGLGRNHRNILSYLHSTGRYEICEAANGLTYGQENCGLTPWKIVGTTPDQAVEPHFFNNNPANGKALFYGHAKIGQIVKDFQPDVYLGMEDIWGLAGLVKQWWWNRPHCVMWTTLDSLPLHTEAIALAPHIKNYLTWSSFASEELNNHGIKADYLFGSIDDKNFYPIQNRLELRRSHGIEDDAFVIGFVFRNQPRKSVPNLLQGFALLKKATKANVKLLFHTNWAEGWDIKKLAAEAGVDLSDILTTHVCSACKKYTVTPFSGHEKDCSCGAKKTVNTPTINSGLSEAQMNEVYNLMDVYCHPFNSGGQEIPIQEAKLCGLATLVTNYSCGVDSMVGGFPLEWTETREAGSQFIKANTRPDDICKKLLQCIELKTSGVLAEMGRVGRQYVIENYSPKAVGGALDDLFQRLGPASYSTEEHPRLDLSFEIKEPVTDAEFIERFLKDGLKGLFSISKEEHDSILSLMAAGVPREEVEFNFKRHAKNHNAADPTREISEFVKPSARKKDVIVVPESIELALAIRYFLKEYSKKRGADIYLIASEVPSQIFLEDPYVAGIIPPNARYLNFRYLRENGFDNVLMLNREPPNLEKVAAQCI